MGFRVGVFVCVRAFGCVCGCFFFGFDGEDEVSILDGVGFSFFFLFWLEVFRVWNR